MKHALLGVAAFLGVSAHTPLPPANVDDARLLVCGGRSGTVWRVQGDRYITAHHVSRSDTCSLDGRPIRTIQSDTFNDFAILSSNRGEGRVYEIDCGGFHEGEVYRGIGWAQGRLLLAVPLMGTGLRSTEPGFAGLTVLRGAVIGGMSGGPVLNMEGKVVGILNASNGYMTLSRPLSETSLCR